MRDCLSQGPGEVNGTGCLAGLFGCGFSVYGRMGAWQDIGRFIDGNATGLGGSPAEQSR